MATFRWDAANPGVENGLTACGLVADANETTLAGTDNRVALNAFFEANPGAVVTIAADTKIGASYFFLKREVDCEILMEDDATSGFVRLAWDGNPATPRPPFISNKPDATRNDVDTPAPGHLVLRGGNIWCQGYNSAHGSVGDIDKKTSLNYGWNVGLEIVGIAFDNTSAITGVSIHGSVSFGAWLLNCEDVVFNYNSVYGMREISAALTAGYINGDGFHINNCRRVTAIGNHFEDLTDDAVAINVDPLLENVPGSEGDPDYDNAINAWSPAWALGGFALPCSDVTILDSTFRRCASGVRVLSMYGEVQENINVSRCAFYDHRGSLLHTNIFGDNGGTQIIDGLTLDDWYFECTMTTNARVNDNPYLAKLYGDADTYPSGVSMKRWTRVDTGVTFADSLKILDVNVPITGGVDLSGFVLSGSSVGRPGYHFLLRGTIAGQLKIGGCRAVRRGATRMDTETVFVGQNTIGAGIDATGGNYVEGLYCLCSFASGGTSEVFALTGTFEAGTGNTFIAPDTNRLYWVAGNPTVSGDFNTLGSVTNTPLFTDPFDATLSDRWDNPGSNSISGGDLIVAADTAMTRKAANITGGLTAARRGIFRVWGLWDAATTGANSDLLIILSGSSDTGYIVVANGGDSNSGNAITGTWDSADLPGLSGDPIGPYGRTNIAQGVEFEVLAFCSADYLVVCFRTIGTNKQMSMILTAPTDRTLGGLFGFGATSNIAGLKIRGCDLTPPTITPSTVTSVTVDGPLSVDLGLTGEFSADVVGTGEGDRGFWVRQSGPGSVDRDTGIYTAPSEYDADATVVLRFVPLADPDEYGEVSFTLNVPEAEVDSGDLRLGGLPTDLRAGVYPGGRTYRRFLFAGGRR